MTKRKFANDLGVIVLLFALLCLLAWSLPAKAADAAIGDSIALGTGNALHIETYARQNMGSCWIEVQTPLKNFDHVVISAGINDPPGSCLQGIRQKVKAGSVTWIVPAAINPAYKHVLNIASEYGDKVVFYTCLGGCSKINFHPGSYAEVAHNVKRSWGE